MGKEKEHNHQDPDYKGELTGKHLRDGPLNDRKCTDLLCLLVFGVFWVGMISIGITAISKGHPMDLTRVYDQNGIACGVNDTQANKYLLFTHTSDAVYPFKLTSSICIDRCPKDQEDYSSANCYSAGSQNPCPDDANNYPTQEYFGKFCVPTQGVSVLVGKGLNFGFFSRAASDLITTWPMILAVGGMALVFGFIYVVLMKYFSGVLIWALLAAFVLASGGFGYVCFTTESGSNTGLGSLSEGELKALSYTCFAVAALSLLSIICLRERITLSIAVLKAAAHFLEDEPGILILPPIFLVLTLLFYVGWIVVAAFIVGTNDFIPPDDSTPFVNVEWTSSGVGMLMYYGFALFWNHALGVAISQFIIASTVCLWYFKHGTKKGGVSPIGRSLKRSVLHMGSLAFGSFLIGLTQFIRFVLKYIANKVNSVPAGENAKARFIVTCCSCVAGCFERALKFLTTHAYVQIAMTGEGFCKATTEAFFLAMRNALRFGMVHVFAEIFLLLGQLIISGSATALGYLIITSTDYYQANVISPIVPAIFFFLTSYIVSHVFMGIYGMSADTIVHCFAMDEEIHDGTVQHAPEELRGYIDNHLSKKLLVEE